MHLLNFGNIKVLINKSASKDYSGVNIQPDPVKFLQLSAPYWKDYAANWTELGYIPPEGCQLRLASSLCPSQSLVVPEGLSYFVNITHCQVCHEDMGSVKYSYFEWIFTSSPGIFGYPGGFACITGICLIIVLTIMVGFALPCVRHSGRFELFYFTHLLFIAYFFLLLFHAPDFWKWFVGPLAVFLVEVLYRLLTTFFGHGKTSAKAAVLFPSNVTGLVINRPQQFKFNPGDWVFIKIPSISWMEWHPFTISSAPEAEDYFTLHIRGVGDWTKKLHAYVKEEHERHKKGLKRNSTNLEKVTASVREKILVAKHSFLSPKREAKEGLLPYYESKRGSQRKKMRERKEIKTQEYNQHGKEKKDKRKKLKSIVGSFYSKTDKPMVQFRKKGEKVNQTNSISLQKQSFFRKGSPIDKNHWNTK